MNPFIIKSLDVKTIQMKKDDDANAKENKTNNKVNWKNEAEYWREGQRKEEGKMMEGGGDEGRVERKVGRRRESNLLLKKQKNLNREPKTTTSFASAEKNQKDFFNLEK